MCSSPLLQKSPPTTLPSWFLGSTWLSRPRPNLLYIDERALCTVIYFWMVGECYCLGDLGPLYGVWGCWYHVLHFNSSLALFTGTSMRFGGVEQALVESLIPIVVCVMKTYFTTTRHLPIPKIFYRGVVSLRLDFFICIENGSFSFHVALSSCRTPTAQGLHCIYDTFLLIADDLMSTNSRFGGDAKCLMNALLELPPGGLSMGWLRVSISEM